MKRKKNLLLLGATVLVLGGVIVAELAVNRHVDSINNTDVEVLAISPEDVEEVKWTYESTTLDFKKTEDTWYSTDDETFPVDQDRLNTFLENFSSVHADFVIEDVEDYDQYGLQNPQCTMTITSSEGETTIKMGDYSSMDSKRYITLDDGTVYLITKDLLEDMKSDRDEFMQQDELGDYVEVDSFKVSGENDLNLVYDEKNHTYSSSYHYYLLKDSDYKALSDSLTESYEGNITDLTLTDYVTYQASEDDLKKYGLDDPVMTIEVSGQAKESTEDSEDASSEDLTDSDEDSYEDYYDSEETDAEASQTEETDAEEVEEEDLIEKAYTLKIGKKGSKYYANVDGSSIIYNFDSEVYENLKDGSYDTLRPTEVVSLNWNKVDQLSWRSDDQEYTIEVSHSGDENTYKFDGNEVEFDDTITAVNALSVNSFEDTKPEKNLELSLNLTVEAGEDAASDVEETTEISLEIYQYDGENCILVVDGENTGLIARDQMVDLKEALEKLVLSQE